MALQVRISIRRELFTSSCSLPACFLKKQSHCLRSRPEHASAWKCPTSDFWGVNSHQGPSPHNSCRQNWAFCKWLERRSAWESLAGLPDQLTLRDGNLLLKLEGTSRSLAECGCQVILCTDVQTELWNTGGEINECFVRPQSCCWQILPFSVPAHFRCPSFLGPSGLCGDLGSPQEGKLEGVRSSKQQGEDP